MVLFWSPFWTENVIISNPSRWLLVYIKVWSTLRPACIVYVTLTPPTGWYLVCLTYTTNRLVSRVSHWHQQQVCLTYTTSRLVYFVTLTPTTRWSLVWLTDTTNRLVSRLSHWHHQQVGILSHCHQQHAGISCVSLTPPAGWYFVCVRGAVVGECRNVMKCEESGPAEGAVAIPRPLAADCHL